MAEADAPHRSAGLALARLLDVMIALRTPETGCAWDLAQTPQTIAPFTIEEAYELAEAIARGDDASIRDELGDLLFNVVYHARMGEERGALDFASVANAAADKMIRRHPHVFGAPDDPLAALARDDLSAAWAAIKSAEKSAEPGLSSALDGVPSGLPAFTRAMKLQKKAQAAGFIWREFDRVMAKLDEELAELREAMARAPAPPERPAAIEPDPHVADEFGDVFFVLVEAARWRDVDPEAALRNANAKFERRFRLMEQITANEGKAFSDLSLDEMVAAWAAAKATEIIR
ncbi:MAG: nucleoside triphosphate pyrophosphohydrolase [Hyphomicrobiales bacterium]|nr:nucleoside triphosphate pyrophosphohydrolase [Hyphomicrobiales bacterium]